MLFQSLILQIISAILGLWLATEFVSGVMFTGAGRHLIAAGLILAFANYFIKPILKFITLPLRMLTFGLFTLLINMGIIWCVAVLFPEITIAGIMALFWTSAIVWGLNMILPKLMPKTKAEN